MEKIASSLLRYLIRMSTRSTPFGLFSGVALGFFGEQTTAQLGDPAIADLRLRQDMHWLQEALKPIETSRSLISQFPVQINPLAYFAGNRILLTSFSPSGQNQITSLRATPILRCVFELARLPVYYLALRDALLQAFPEATSEQVEKLLSQLLEHGLLHSFLHPPLTHAHPLPSILEQLETIQGAEELRLTLEGMLVTLTNFNTANTRSKINQLARLVELPNTVVSSAKQQPAVHVDSLLSLQSPTLHQNIGSIAAQAAELLLRLTPTPETSTSLNQYRSLFLEKYGEHAEVPLLELLSPEQGLGVPSSYTQRTHLFHNDTRKENNNSENRERVLLRLMQEALFLQKQEIDLTEDHLKALETWHPMLEQAPHSLEITLQIGAKSRKALDEGNFCVVVGSNTGSRSAGRTFGRFLDLLGEPAIRSLQSLLAQEEALLPDTIFAELSYLPGSARSMNVAVRPCLRKYEIAVGTTPFVTSEHTIPLNDLVVGVEHNRFYLRSQKHNKRVIVNQLHMLNTRSAPHVCRFLLEISSDGLPQFSSFDWGNLSYAPFLPRLVIRAGQQVSLVLSPARWTLESSSIHIQGEEKLEERWFAGLQNWRKNWHVPRYVYLTQADNRLLLDLEHPKMALLLQRELNHLRAGKHVTLEELIPDFDQLWLRDQHNAPYFSEIVVPLLRCSTSGQHIPLQSPKHMKTWDSPAHVASKQDRVFPPGSAWNYVKLYCTPAQQDEIIAGSLSDLIGLLSKQKLIDHWFFLRYADPSPHLRLRIHTPVSKDIESALSLLLAFCRELVTRGMIQRLSLDTYEREVARYGGPAAIGLIEQVMCLDSQMCQRIIAAQYTHRLTLDPLATACVSLDHFFDYWGYDQQHRLEWLEKRIEKHTFREEFHSKRKHYSSLLARKEDHVTLDPELLAQRNLLLSLIAPVQNSIAELATQVHALARSRHLWVTEDELLASLAHMHKVRLLDLDRNKEQQLYAYWHYSLGNLYCRSGMNMR